MDLEKLNSNYFLQGLAEGNMEVLLHKVFFDSLYHTGRRGKESKKGFIWSEDQPRGKKLHWNYI